MIGQAPTPTRAPDEEFRDQRIAYWDGIAARPGPAWGAGYHARLESIYRSLIPPGKRVMELGCGRADLLAAVRPSRGVGVDFSQGMLAQARRRHPDLELVHADVHSAPIQGRFDVIILSDLISELWDVQRVLGRIGGLCHARTRIIINTYSRLWDWPLRAVRALGLARPTLDQNWFTADDVRNLLGLSGFETLRHWQEVLLPLGVPLAGAFCNRVLVRLPPLNHLALCNFLVARPAPGAASPPARVSVIVPARNEAGNIPALIERTPAMGAGTELIFVEGHSTDGTYEAIREAIAARPDAVLLRQSGKGKGDAVRMGFDRATGDILMILDADLTVAPEDLPRFYDALVRNQAELVNGVRLVYPMGRRAMRPLNLIANKLFGAAFTWLLGQRIKDTLCGTKALYAADYRDIAARRAELGDFDPFGDFDLLFGAARLNLKIVDMPVRYADRTYGSTNIHRFRHGWLLLRMVAFAARRIKFR